MANISRVQLAVDSTDVRKATTALGRMEDQGRDTARSVDRMERSTQGLGRSVSRTNQSIQRSTGVNRRWADSLSSVRSVLGPLVGAVSLGMLGRMATQSLAATAALSEQADVAGVSAERLQELQKSLSDLGGVAEATTGGALRRFNRRLGLAADGSGAAADTFGELGIAIETAGGRMRSTESVLDDAIEELSGIESESLRAARASELFGEDAGPRLAAVLGQGEDALRDHSEALREDGRIMEDELVAQARAANDELARMRDIITTDFNRQVAENADSVVLLGEAIANLAKWSLAAVGAVKQTAEMVAELVHGPLPTERLEQLNNQIDRLQARRENTPSEDSWYSIFFGQTAEDVDVEIDRLKALREELKETYGLVEDPPKLDPIVVTTPKMFDPLDQFMDMLGLLPMTLDDVKSAQDATRSSTEDLASGQSDSAESSNELGRALDRLKRELDPTAAATADYLEDVDTLDEAWARGTISGREHERLMRALATGTEDVADSTRTATDDTERMVDVLESGADVAQKAWENSLRRIDDAFADVWRGAFDSFQGFADSLQSAFKNLLAELAHAATTRPIMIKLGVAGGILPSAASASTQAGGGVPGLGNIGSLLGGSGVANSLNQVFQGSATGPFQGAGGLGMFGGSNLGFGLAGLGGGLIGSQFGGLGGIGGSIGGAAGFGLASGGGAIGSALGGLGSFAGPIGAIAGSLLGGVLGSLFGSEPDDADFFVGSRGGPSHIWEEGRGTDLAGGLRIRQDRGDILNASQRSDVEAAMAASLGPSVEAINDVLTETAGVTIGEAMDSMVKTNDFVREHLGEDMKIEEASAVLMSRIARRVIDGLDGDSAFAAVAQQLNPDAEGFGGRVVQLANLFGQVKKIRDAGSVSGQARDARETQTATQSFRDQSNALRDLVREYDGSVQSTQELAAAFARTNQSAVSLAAGLMGVSDRVDATLNGLAESIRQDLMSEEELFEHRRERIHGLVDDLSDMEDPQRIMSTIDQIEQRTAQLWQSLEQSQKEALGEGFLGFLDETNELVQARIDGAIAGIDQDMDQLGGQVAEKFGLSADAMQAAASQQGQSAAAMQSAASTMRSAAATMQSAASKPTRVQVTVRQPEVG